MKNEMLTKLVAESKEWDCDRLKSEYEALAHECDKAHCQLAEYGQMRQDQMLLQRLDYLFRVVEDKAFEGDDFYQECLEEIKLLMRLPEELKAKMADAAAKKGLTKAD